MRRLMRACVAGLLGTTALGLVAYSGYPSVASGVPLDIAGMLGAPVDSWLAGLLALFVLGTLVAPVLYVVAVGHVLPGGELRRGVTWGLLIWLVVQLAAGPLRTGGLFSRRLGGPPMAIGLLVGLLVYGAMFGAVMREAPGAGAVERPSADDALRPRRTG